MELANTEFRERGDSTLRPALEALLLLLAVLVISRDASAGHKLVLLGAVAVPALWSSATRANGQVMLLWGTYLVSFTAFVLLRSVADETGRETFVQYVIRADELIGFGHVPTLLLQEWWHTAGAILWYDWVASVVYISYFGVMAALALVLMVRRSPLFAPLLIAAALIHVAALPFHFLWPTAPPWLAGQGSELAHVTRILYEVGHGASPDLYNGGLDASGNDVAAMPSVHMAITWLVFLAGARVSRVGYALGLVYAVAMAWATVYGGEHYVVDLLAGMVLAWLGWRAALYLTQRFRLQPPGHARS